MPFLPSLFACLALLLPIQRSMASDLPGVDHCHVLNLGHATTECDLFSYPTDFPPNSEKLFERLDETALDEEDSIQVEDRGIIPSDFLDQKTTLVSHLSNQSELLSGHLSRRISLTILRC
jgi:hypothetical protein